MFLSGAKSSCGSSSNSEPSGAWCHLVTTIAHEYVIHATVGTFYKSSKTKCSTNQWEKHLTTSDNQWTCIAYSWPSESCDAFSPINKRLKAIKDYQIEKWGYALKNCSMRYPQVSAKPIRCHICLMHNPISVRFDKAPFKCPLIFVWTSVARLMR